MASCKCPVCAYVLTPADVRWLRRAKVAELADLKVRSVDRLDADEGPDRTFPRSKRVKLPGRKRGFRRWLKCEIITWLKLAHNG